MVVGGKCQQEFVHEGADSLEVGTLFEDDRSEWGCELDPHLLEPLTLK